MVFSGVVVALAGVFVLPWYVPLPGPVKGESYSLGFCNRAAVLSLYGAIGLVAWGLIFRGKKSTGLSWLTPSPILLPSWRKALGEYSVLGGASLICATVILAWGIYLVIPYWGESNNFLCRIDLARLGYRPYIDFQFDYGPALIYLPIGLDLLSGNRLGIENAYNSCVALGFVLGFLALFIFLRCLQLPDRDRPWILALPLLWTFSISMGLQYIPLRYTLLPCAIAVGNVALQNLTEGRRAFIFTLVAIMGCNASCYLISPEMGIAGSAAFVLIGIVFVATQKIRQAVICFLGATACLIWVAGFSQGYLHSIRSFGAGAYNFPIYPNLPNLMLLGASLYILPQLACAVWREPGHPMAPLAAGLGMAALVLLPAAFGRCDPGHVLGNGLIQFLLLFPAFAQAGRPVLMTRGLAFGMAFILLNQIGYWLYYWPQWQGALRARRDYAENPGQVLEWAEAWKALGRGTSRYEKLNWHKVIPFPSIEPELIPADARVVAPWGEESGVDRYLKLRSTFAVSYYPTLNPEIFTPEDVVRAVHEIKANHALMLIPKGFYTFLLRGMDGSLNQENMQNYLTLLMLYPVRSTFRNKPYVPEFELAKGLLKGSTLVAEGRDYVLIRPPP